MRHSLRQTEETKRRGRVMLCCFFFGLRVRCPAKLPNCHSNTVALHCLHYVLSHYVLQGLQENCATPPSKGPRSTYLFELLKGVSHFKLSLGRCRSTGGCRSYTVACRATVGHLGIRQQYLIRKFKRKSLDPAVSHRAAMVVETSLNSHKHLKVCSM